MADAASSLSLGTLPVGWAGRGRPGGGRSTRRTCGTTDDRSHGVDTHLDPYGPRDGPHPPPPRHVGTPRAGSRPQSTSG